MDFTVKPIAYIKTPFSQKFGIPRQANLATEAIGEIHFEPHIKPEEACLGIEQFSHLWIVFVFDQNLVESPKMSVRPPRLGGNKKVGVFASRASFRPNPIGMSVVQNLGLEEAKTSSPTHHCKKVLRVAGIDMMDNTPILDIKPYIAYSDSIQDANCGYADEAPNQRLLDVQFSECAMQDLLKYNLSRTLVEQVLAQDPRPAYKKLKQDNKEYFIRIENVDICFAVKNGVVDVKHISPASFE